MGNPDAPSQRGKAVLHDRTAGLELPIQFQNSPPMVTWRCAECSGRILRLYLAPEGWYLHGEHFRLSMDQWAGRNSDDRGRYNEEKATGFDPRKKRGMGALLPLDFDLWPSSARFEAGCKRCGEGLFSLDELKADAAKVRATRAPMDVRKPRPVVT